MQKEGEPIIDQEVVLDDAQTNVSRSASLMKTSLENQNLREGLKYASEMISNLKTTQLSPKFYFILCIFSAC